MRRTLTDRLLRATEAPDLRTALRRVGEYAALRAWIAIIGCFPIEWNLHTGRLLGRIWWWASRRHRERALENLRPALGRDYTEAQLREIARRSFEHFAQLYTVEVALTPRLISTWAWARHVELGRLASALRALLAGRGCILLTPHFGNYELLGLTLCQLGLPITAVMRPLDNPLVNRFLVASRERGGMRLLFKKGVSAVAGEILDRGGALSFIADQDAGRKGVFVEFFGRKASTYKSIGLLAMHKRVPIVVGAAHRVGRRFRYHMDVERVIQPPEWEGRDDPLLWVTQEFSHAMERLIRRHPEQYLWVHRRWKHRPKEELAAADEAGDRTHPVPDAADDA